MTSSEDSEDDNAKIETRKLMMAQNRKKKKSGGFQAMGLSHAVFKGIIRKGYKLPTPIQRKTIPVILDGKDVVAMARTGSGKTAAFLVPMLEKLKSHSSKGARALILSPTRELALQTLKFSKELGKFTDLRAAVILGGDKMEDQFSSLHQNPDIIVATPGRILHVLVEMNKSLKEIEYIVFDEADRLFEMGFAEQLREILQRVPETRQTLLFSATLPKTLVAFARAGLTDPTLIRLDVDTKLSAQLKLSYLSCRADAKPAILLYLLREIIDKKEQTVVFAATKHHVEYLHCLLTKANISNTYIYSSLDQTARKISVARFQQRQIMVMIVTDLAARGLDIPQLDNVINYNFPAKAKMFVHRVGRVARAGRSGVAYSLIAADELAYVVDLHVFLGRSLKVVPSSGKVEDDDGYFGNVPQSIVDEQNDDLQLLHKESLDLQNLQRVSQNAYKQYLRSRPQAAMESIKRAKQLEKDGIVLGIHPIFNKVTVDIEEERLKLLNALKSYKSNTTIFEVNATTKKPGCIMMKEKRNKHGHIVSSNRERREQLAITDQPHTEQAVDYDSDLEDVFSRVIGPGAKKAKSSEKVKIKKKRKIPVRDDVNYLPYRPADHQTEEGYSMGNSFNNEISSAVLDFTGDDEQNMRTLNSARKWDRKRKKFITESGEGKAKKIKTESGNWIPASYKSNLYNTWREKHKIEDKDQVNDSDNEGNKKGNKKKKGTFQVMGLMGRKRHTKGSGTTGEKMSNNKRKFKGSKRELKSSDQILKERRRKSKLQAFQKQRQTVHSKRRLHAKGKKSN